jgi:hypothetical protein
VIHTEARLLLGAVLGGFVFMMAVSAIKGYLIPGALRHLGLELLDCLYTAS